MYSLKFLGILILENILTISLIVAIIGGWIAIVTYIKKNENRLSHIENTTTNTGKDMKEIKESINKLDMNKQDKTITDLKLDLLNEKIGNIKSDIETIKRLVTRNNEKN